MSLNNNQVITINPFKNIQSNTPDYLKEKWKPLALSEDSANDINILDEIGDDWFSESDTTLNRVNKKLAQADGKDITVNINSFGGSMFEGLAIYNALCQHKGKVTVNVLGVAASAASLIAMAGDEIKISPSAFLMIHNSAVIIYGNKNEMQDWINKLSKFDEAMAKLYASKTGIDKAEIAKMMDEETWLDGEIAVEKGFATEILTKEIKATANNSVYALRKIDEILAKQGIPRSERRDLINQVKGTQDATQKSTQDAAHDEALAIKLRALSLTL